MVSRPVKYALRQTYTTAMRSRTVRDVLYDRWNSTEFTDVYEHEKMLGDRVRVDTYHEAIDRLVGPDDVVVDLGTGTGILAMFAARRARHVYAIDHSPFIELAQRVAAHNGFDNITFVREHSKDFSPPEPIDVVIHEQMGDELLNENMIDNLLDLRRRVMAPGGRILPARFEFFIEPVSLIDELRVPSLWELDVHGLDFTFLEGDEQLRSYTRKGYGHRRIAAGDVARYLGEPEPVLTFDLDRMDDPGTLPTSFDVTRRVTEAGVLDGFCVWFRATFDERTSLSTGPLDPWTCWTNRLYRTKLRSVVPGDEISYTLRLDDPLRPGTWVVSMADSAMTSSAR
jgi:type I protein arginine methyltransferase